MLLQTTNLKPIDFTQGDTALLTLIATDAFGNPVDLTGASLSTEMLGPNGVGVVTFPNGQHTLANQTTNRGQFTLALGASDTASCGEGANKQIITVATIVSPASTTYYRGNNILTVYPPIPVQ